MFNWNGISHFHFRPPLVLSMDVSSITPTIYCSKETLPLFLEPFSFAIKKKHQK